MFYYDNDDEEFYDLDDFNEEEFGDIKKKKKVFIKKLPKSVKSTLGGTTRKVRIQGYLTWNTFFHLSANVGFNIHTALNSSGFSVDECRASNRDKTNSQYYFYLTLNVYMNWGTRTLQENLVRVLTSTVALPGSIRFTSISDDFNG